MSFTESDALTLAALEQWFQAQLEFAMKNAGVQAYLTSLNEAQGDTESETSYGARLLRGTIQAAGEKIAGAIKEATSGRAGPRAAGVAHCRHMDPQVLAYLTGKALIDAASSRHLLTKAALRVGGMVEDEQRLAKFAEANPGAFEWTMKRIEGKASRAFRRGVTVKLMKLKEVAWQPWGAKPRLLVGTWLIEHFIQATGLFSIEMEETHHKTNPYIVAAPDTLKWIAEAAKHGEMMATEYWPTVIPPKPWRKPWGGGYHTPLVPKLPLVKVRGHKGARAYLEELSHMDMSPVYEAVNAVQNTPWRVNKAVLDVMRECVAQEIPVKHLPPPKDAGTPPKPGDFETNEQAKKWWKKAAAITRTNNARAASRRIQVRRTVDMAERFEKFPAIYFPHTMDFRGRMYAVPPFLNPQGPDFAKGLLTFAEGKPIDTEEQLYWLAVHGANSYGIDKVAFDERWNWVVDHDAHIRAVAAAPLGDHMEFWTQADAPFQFLAFCFEWAAVMAHGYGYVSTLPVALDGSCNGIQHYSAALRDPIGGAAVNLTPADKPQDIYARVAERVIDKVTRMKDLSGDEGRFARAWLAFGITRKTTKRSVMTLPYGCTQFSVREFVEQAMRETIEEDGKPNVFATVDEKGDRKDSIFEASRFLQPLVWQAIGEVVVAARAAMDWLQATARIVAKEGLPIVWTTPDGFPVQQAYVETKTTRVETKLDGRTDLRIQEDTHTMDRRRQSQGIAPNWVHSMDAAALRLYVRLAHDNGVRCFALVHDSYGAPAGDVPMVAACLREAFVMLYQERDALARFREEVAAPLPDEARAEVAESPAMGTLDLAQVRASQYFFA